MEIVLNIRVGTTVTLNNCLTETKYEEVVQNLIVKMPIEGVRLSPPYNQLNGNARHIDRLHTKRGGHTPYGYAYLDGQLLIDPKEQIIVRIILKFHQSGKSGNAIATELNNQKISSRTGKTWRPCVVRRIIKANQTKENKKRRGIK